MKIFLYFFLFTFNFCQSQGKNQIAIIALKDSIECVNLKEKYVFEIPFIHNKNENNFFNNTIIADYVDYLDTNNENFTPQEIIQYSIKKRKEECEINNNFSGFIGSNYNETFNNFKLVSIIMNYQLLAGNLTVDNYYYNFDIDLEKNLNSKDVFKENKIKGLIKKCNTILKERISNLYKNNRSNIEISEIYNSLKTKELFNIENLNNFIIKDNHFIFIYDYGFPNGTVDIENNIAFSIQNLNVFFKDDFKNKILFKVKTNEK